MDHYIDVIEGNGAFYGIPGHYPHDEGLADATDTPLTVAGVATLSTTTFDVAASYSWVTLRWVKSDTPGFWAHCTTTTSPNYGQARKITNYNNSHLAPDGVTRAPLFTVALPFSHAPVAGEVYEILQGFKHPGHGVDLEKDYPGVEHGFDRFFSISVDQGKELEYYGAGVRTYTGTLSLKLRVLKYAKSHDAEKSALENLSIIRSVLTRSANPDLRDGTYTRALLPTDGKIATLKEDASKIVKVDTFPIVYRIGVDFP